MSELTDRPFPRTPLIGAGGLIALAFIAVAAVRLTGTVITETEPTPAVETRELVFEDRNDGGVGVFDARDRREIAVLPSGTNGFLRAVLRGLARERRSRGFGAEVPFRIARHADGQLTLEDPTTGRQVFLAAFGSTNAEAFARFLR